MDLCFENERNPIFTKPVLAKCSCSSVSTKYGYEVPGMMLLQLYLHIYSLLRGVIFEVHPLNGYACSPTIL